MKFVSMVFAALMLLGVIYPTQAGSQETPGVEATVGQPTAQSPPGKVAILNVNMREGFIAKDQCCPANPSGQHSTAPGSEDPPTQDDIFWDASNCANDMDPGPNNKDCQLEVRNLGLRVLEMDEFVRRAPDVVVLQEIVHKSAVRAAEALTYRLGFTYEAVVTPTKTSGNYPVRARGGDETRCSYWEDGNQLQGAEAKYLRETAILVNTSTMTYGTGGYGTSQQRCDEVKRNEKIDGRTFRDYAYLWVAEQPDPNHPTVAPLEMAVANLHYVRKTTFASDEADTAAKQRWTNNIADELATLFPATPTRVIAGDFNAKACPGTEQERLRCGTDDHTPFWADLKNLHGYYDAVWTVNNSNAALDQQHCAGDTDPNTDGCQNGRRAGRIDYIFAREANICRADHDWKYLADSELVAARRTDFYSDHRFVFSQIGAAGGEACGSQ